MCKLKSVWLCKMFLRQQKKKIQHILIQRIRVNSYTALLCKLTMTAAYTERENAGGSNIRDIWNIRGRPNLEKEQPLNKPTSITSCPGHIFHDYCCCGAGHCSSGWKTVMIKHSFSLFSLSLSLFCCFPKQWLSSTAVAHQLKSEHVPNQGNRREALHWASII